MSEEKRIDEWRESPLGGLEHVYYAPELLEGSYPDGDSLSELPETPITECDLYGHSWRRDPDDQYRCIRCGEEQF